MDTSMLTGSLPSLLPTNMGVLYWGLFISIVGYVLFRYGRKRHDGLSIATGLILMIYPYFTGSLAWSISIGVVVFAAFIFLRRIV